MKKVNLVIIGLLMLLSLPMITAVFGASSAGQITDVAGNDTKLYFNLTTAQMTANPGAGANVSYVTTVTVIAGHAHFNLTMFIIQLPDNHTTRNLASLIFSNTSSTFNLNKSANKTATVFTPVEGKYNTANFSGLDAYFNHTGSARGWANESQFKVYWIMSAPITSTKITAARNGRVWTETWNITSAASNVTIDNASLLVIPTYWYSKIGDPTAVTFNATALTGYISNCSSIEPFTDLNLSSNGNLLVYGSGYQTLSISYNGPSIDSSSGSSPSAVVSVLPTTAREVGLWVLISIASLVVIGGVVFFVVMLRKR
jgi:hypothetical protein